MASKVASSISSSNSKRRRNPFRNHRVSRACGKCAAQKPCFVPTSDVLLFPCLTLHIEHCRRRKIRCLPAPRDPQERHLNSIRLKKECNFLSNPILETHLDPPPYSPCDQAGFLANPEVACTYTAGVTERSEDGMSKTCTRCFMEKAV
jgi:hypothetical protein